MRVCVGKIPKNKTKTVSTLRIRSFCLIEKKSNGLWGKKKS